MRCVRRTIVLLLMLCCFWVPLPWRAAVEAQGLLWNGDRTLAGTLNTCIPTGGTDSYACNLAPAISAYRLGACYTFKADVANTGAATLALNGLTAKTIKKVVGTDLGTGDIVVNRLVHVCYDGTNMQCDNCDGNIPTTGGAGTVTSIATTSPITGGTITGSGTIACASCATAAGTLTLNQLAFGDDVHGVKVGNLTGDVTTSGGTATTIANAAVTLAKMANMATASLLGRTTAGSGAPEVLSVLPTATMPALTGDVTNSAGSLATTLATKLRTRTCVLTVGSDNGAVVLANADLGPQLHGCRTDVASTVTEIAVQADAGTPNVIVHKRTGTTNTALLSSALATAASGAVACSKTTAVTGLDGATTCSATLQNNTAIPAGYTFGLTSGTAGGTAKRMSVFVTMTTD